MKQAIYKVPGGKLLKVFVRLDGSSLSEVKITGDFFIYPEESIDTLESAVRGMKLEKTPLLDALNACVETEDLELFGVTTESIVHTLFMAAGLNTESWRFFDF